MCATALQILDDLLGKKSATPHTVIPARLIERDSFRLN